MAYKSDPVLAVHPELLVSLAGLPMVLLMLWFAIRRRRIPFADYLGLRGTSWKNVIIGIVALALVAVVFLGSPEKVEPLAEEDDGTPFDAFAGGYPVPPMPGQRLPELAGVVPGTADQAAPAASDHLGEDE